MNGYTSPFFEAHDKNFFYTEIKTLTIDMSSEVRSISMLIDSGIWYYGIRFYDDDHELLLNS